jgi:hypothetical protein
VSENYERGEFVKISSLLYAAWLTLGAVVLLLFAIPAEIVKEVSRRWHV